MGMCWNSLNDHPNCNSLTTVSAYLDDSTTTKKLKLKRINRKSDFIAQIPCFVSRVQLIDAVSSQLTTPFNSERQQEGCEYQYFKNCLTQRGIIQKFTTQ